MSVFRDAIVALEDKEIYIFLGGEVKKVKVNNVVDDLVKISILEGGGGVGEMSLHIDNIVLVSA